MRPAAAVAVLALAPLAWVQQPAGEPAPQLLDRIWEGVQRAQNRTKTGRGTITETRTSKMLVRPLVFHGRFQASGLTRFYLEYEEPEPVRIVFNQDYLNVTTGGDKRRTEVLKVGEQVRRTQSYFSCENSIGHLKENFIVTAKEDRTGYEMRLVPKSPRFKKRINYVVVQLNHDDFLLRGLEVDGASGVNSRFQIHMDAVNAPVDENLFKVYRPSPR